MGGSADLNPSTFTALTNLGDFQSPAGEYKQSQGAAGGGFSYAGRNVYFGVREHGMGAAINGMAAHGGIIPFGSTFLIFSDYLRPSIRLAALMELGVIYVFTHDSIGVGEDGPTHQPIEQLAALRAIPRLIVIRPGDANETAAAWRIAIETRNAPVALALSRQNLPTLDRNKYAPADGVRKGGYVLSDAGRREAGHHFDGQRFRSFAHRRSAGETRTAECPGSDRFDAELGAVRSQPRSIANPSCRPRYGRASRWRLRCPWVGTVTPVIAAMLSESIDSARRRRVVS